MYQYKLSLGKDVSHNTHINPNDAHSQIKNVLLPSNEVHGQVGTQRCNKRADISPTIVFSEYTNVALQFTCCLCEWFPACKSSLITARSQSRPTTNYRITADSPAGEKTLSHLVLSTRSAQQQLTDDSLCHTPSAGAPSLLNITAQMLNSPAQPCSTVVYLLR